MTHLSFPDVTNPRVEVVTIIPWFTGNADKQHEMIDTIKQVWETKNAPAGLVAGHCFASVDRQSLLFYLQWESVDAAKNIGFSENSPVYGRDIRPFGSPHATVYRLYQSLEGTGQGKVPTHLICAFFDTDGPERQRYIADSLIELAKDLPDNPAALLSHFHLSLDGTRVINYTAWSNVGSHDIQADEGAYDEIYRISSSTPGVRSLRGNQYWHAAQRP